MNMKLTVKARLCRSIPLCLLPSWNYDDDHDDYDDHDDLKITIIMRVKQVVPIYPPLSSAKLEGLHEGAKLNKVHCQHHDHHHDQHHTNYHRVDDQHRYYHHHHNNQYYANYHHANLNAPGRRDPVELRDPVHPRGRVPHLDGRRRDTGRHHHHHHHHHHLDQQRCCSIMSA